MSQWPTLWVLSPIEFTCYLAIKDIFLNSILSEIGLKLNLVIITVNCYNQGLNEGNIKNYSGIALEKDLIALKKGVIVGNPL